MAAAAYGWGGSYVPLHGGAAVKRCDEAEEVSGFGSRGRENSRASLRDESNVGFGPSNRYMAGGTPSPNHVSSDVMVGLAEDKA